MPPYPTYYKGMAGRLRAAALILESQGDVNPYFITDCFPIVREILNPVNARLCLANDLPTEEKDTFCTPDIESGAPTDSTQKEFCQK